MPRTPYTLAHAYRDIRGGAEPWTPINEFLHEWADYSRDNQDSLIAEPLPDVPEPGETDGWRWAVFCVGMVEYLCEKDSVPRPAWVDRPAYTLDAPWFAFDAPGLAKSAVREEIMRTTPEPLRRRNVFCGGRAFITKYDFARSIRDAR